MKRITVIGKRPATATREAGLKLRENGLTYQDIATLWHVSRSRVHQILNPKNGKRVKPAQPATIHCVILPPQKRPNLVITEATK